GRRNSRSWSERSKGETRGVHPLHRGLGVSGRPPRRAFRHTQLGPGPLLSFKMSFLLLWRASWRQGSGQFLCCGCGIQLLRRYGPLAKYGHDAAAHLRKTTIHEEPPHLLAAHDAKLPRTPATEEGCSPAHPPQSAVEHRQDHEAARLVEHRTFGRDNDAAQHRRSRLGGRWRAGRDLVLVRGKGYGAHGG